MNETTTGTTPTSHLPPILPPQHGAGGPGPGTGQGARQGALDRFLVRLRDLPARRTDRAVLGGVCATVAERLGVSPVAVRLAAVLSVLALGTGVGIYLIAWTLLPDASGTTHLERGLRHGAGRSLLVLALGGLAALGVLTGALAFLAAILPQLLAVAALGALGWWLWSRTTDRSRTTS